MLTNESVYNKKKKLPWRIIEDEVVIVDLEREQVMNFNEVGKDIWTLIDGKNSFSIIIEKIKEIYDTDEQKAKQDITNFIQNLAEKNLIYEENFTDSNS